MSFSLDRKAAVDAIRKKYKDERSSHTFDNLYVWRKPWKIDLYLEDDMYAASLGDAAENTWYFPLGDDERRRRFIAERMNAGHLQFHYMSEKDAAFLEESFPGKFAIERERLHDEYVTRFADHLAESGKKNQEFRRKWKRFRESGSYSFRRVDEFSGQAIRSVLSGWYENKPCTDADREEMNTLEADAFFEQQPDDFEKWVVYEGENPIGVAAGYPITDKVYNFCILKENGTIKNANYGIFRLMMEKLRDRYEYFNEEDDLDLPGLRQMKTERLPFRMNEMWKASMK